MTYFDADFVSDLLAADAAEPEAWFDSLVDMLDWLNAAEAERAAEPIG